MRAMAIDPGEKRWGLAVSDEDGEMAHSRPALLPKSPAEGVRLVASFVRDEEVKVIVLGLPLELSGREGPAAKKARVLAAELRAQVGVDVALWDERLSSVAAQRSLRERGLSSKAQRGKVDSVAAAMLLQSFLDAAPAVRARALVAAPKAPSKPKAAPAPDAPDAPAGADGARADGARADGGERS